MRARFPRGVVGVIAALLLLGITFGPGPRAATETRNFTTAPNEQPGMKPVPPLIRAQLEWLELQKKHIEEQLLEQIQQLEQDTKRQITQLRQQARRQTEILDAQKRLYLAQVESQLAEMGLPAANAAGRPPAILPAIAEKLDKILERLENIDKRLQKLEKGTTEKRDTGKRDTGKRDKKAVGAPIGNR